MLQINRTGTAHVRAHQFRVDDDSVNEKKMNIKKEVYTGINNSIFV